MSDPGSRGRQPVAAAVLSGIAAAPGVAVGPALVLAHQEVSYVRRSLRSAEVDEEIARFRRSVRLAQEELRAMGRDGSLSSKVRIVADKDDEKREREKARKAAKEAKRQAERERLSRLGY